MAFKRQFDKIKQVKEVPLFEVPLFKEKLLEDIRCGDPKQIVFPAIRDNTLDFYHGGGVLFRYSGTSFKRNRAYDPDTKTKKQNPVTQETYGVSFYGDYKRFKDLNRGRFADGERQYLEPLYIHTYKGGIFPGNSVCVLDIEVRFNVGKKRGKKFDLLLLDTRGEVWRIMPVEVKIFGDSRMTDKRTETENIFEQIEAYNGLITECGKKAIEEQYKAYISIMSKLFSETEVDRPIELVEDTKLLVYEAPTDKESYRVLKQKLEEANIDTLWVGRDAPKEELPTLEEIWDALYR